MLTSRAIRGGRAWKLAWVSLAAAVAVLTGGCAADVTGPAVTTSHPTTTGQTTTTGSLPEHEGSVITLVGAGPGTQTIGLDDGSGGTSARLTVVIDA